MELYIEYVILDNYLIDYIILTLIEKTINIKIKKFNKNLCCILGMLMAVFIPFLYRYKAISILYRLLTSIIMVMCIKRYKRLKNFLVYYLMFITYTFLIGGVILGIINLLHIDYTMSGIFMYKFEFPLGLFISIFLLVIRLIFISVKLIKNKLQLSNYLYELTIKNGEICEKTTAFLDTGNNVKFNSVGVNIISMNLFLKLYKDIDLYQLLLNKTDLSVLRKHEYIDICGVGKTEKYLSFEVDEIEVCGQVYKDTRVAVAMKNFVDYECVLHKDFIGGKL